VIFVFPRFTR